MTYSESQKRASRKYNEANYDRVGLYLPKNGEKEKWQNAAKERGMTVSELIITAVDEYLAK